MPEDNFKDQDSSESRLSVTQTKFKASSQVVTADSVQAEEVPTIPLGPLQSLSTLRPEVTVRSVEATQRVSMPAPLVVQPAEYRRNLGEWLRIWWEGMRPAYLPLSLLPFALGSVLAWTSTIRAELPLGSFHLLAFVLGLLALLLLQLGAHLVNDYYDYLRGIDVSNTLGPGKLIQQGLIQPTRVLSIGLVFLVLGAVVGIAAAWQGSWLVLPFGLIGLLCAYFYSATTRSLSSLMLGDLVIFGLFGPLITLGAYILQTGHFERTALLCSLVPGLLATATIHVNNMRDTEGDLLAGKRTLATTLDLPWNRVFYLILALGAYAITLALGLPRGAPHLILISFWTLPTLVVAVSGILRTDAPAGQHLVMRQTLKLETFFILLFCLGLIVTAFWFLVPQLPTMNIPFF